MPRACQRAAADFATWSRPVLPKSKRNVTGHGETKAMEIYHAQPPTAPRAGLVVLQEVFGLNSHIRSVADGWAADGFEVLAPALFDRVEPGIALDYSPASVQEGVRLVKALDGPDQPLEDVAVCIQRLAAQGLKVSVIGFCWGGTLSWLAAARLPLHRAVGYYGGGIYNNRHEKPNCPVMLHFGAHDKHILPEHVEAIAAEHPQVTIHRYEAGHGFNCDQRGDYEPGAAALARQRSLEFLQP